MTPEMESEKKCLHHISHEYRIGLLEEKHEEHEIQIQELEKNMKNPSLMIALISLFGVIVSAGAAFAGVILTPIITPIMKAWGWL